MDSSKIAKEDLNEVAFSKLDLKKHAGECIAMVNGKVVITEKDATKAMKKVVALSEKNQVALICIPSSKTTMCI